MAPPSPQDTGMEPGWRIDLLGVLRAYRDDRVIDRFRTQKTAGLLACLTYYSHRTHPREELIEILWSGDTPEAGRHKLSVALSSLRQQLEPAGITDGSVLAADRFHIRLLPSAVHSDLAEFDAGLRTAARATDDEERLRLLEATIALYRGELLSGLYDSWIFTERQAVAERFLQALRQLVLLKAKQGDREGALQTALTAVSADPLREEVQQEVIRLYLSLNQPASALRQYRELEQLLRDELDAMPSRATYSLIEAALEEAAPAEVRVPTGPSRPVKEPVAAAEPSGAKPLPLEPVGGAVPLGSPFYVERTTDPAFQNAIQRRDSIVLVKGARQVGKTSLLARGLQQARERGSRVVFTDFQSLNAAHLESPETLLLALAHAIADQLDLDVLPSSVWDPERGPNPNFRRYFRREVLGDGRPLVWGMDEVDRLFVCPFASEIFGLFRSWHNERALDPTGPWTRLTMVIAYATEAHLFISDVNQSPFNVGTRLALEEFTLNQVLDLNRRYGSPMNSTTQAERYYDLLGGHPFLVRCGLQEMASGGLTLEQLEAQPEADEGPFAAHLRRILLLLGRDPDLTEGLREVLRGRPCPSLELFYRLRSAGILAGDSAHDARARCRLYAAYLSRHLL